MTHRTMKRPRYRCHHPSGMLTHPYCMKPATTAVRIRFGVRWSKPIPACDEHGVSKEWYEDRETYEWLPVRKSTLNVYAQALEGKRRKRVERVKR